MKKFITKAISLICVLVMLAAFTPSALAYTEETVINWADKTVYSSVSGSCAYDVKNNKTTMDALFGGVTSPLAGSGYNVELAYPVTYDAEFNTVDIGTTPISKFLVDLGAERNIDYIDLYQFKDRIKKIEVYEVTDVSKFNAAKNTAASISDNFMNGSYMVLLGEATFDNGGNAATTLNTLDNCNDPDRITFSETKNARYLFFAVTEALTGQGYDKILLQKITINQKGSLGIKAVKNWADKSIYSNVTGVFPTGTATGAIGNLSENDAHSLFGVGNSSTKNSGYNIILNNPVAQTGTANTARSKFEIDLGAERSINYIDLYQYKNRIAEIKVYKMSEQQYTQANNGVCYLSDNFVNGTTLIGEATFDHGTNAELILNSVDECTTPDRIEFATPVDAQYLLFVVTKVVPSSNTKYQLQKITVNSVTNTLDASALEYDVELFQNSGEIKNVGVFAAQKNEDMMVDCDIIKTDVANLSQVNLFANKIKIDSSATSIVFIILDMTTLEPLFKVPYAIEKN